MKEKLSTQLKQKAQEARENYESANGIAQPPRRMVRPDLWEDAWQRGFKAGIEEAAEETAGAAASLAGIAVFHGQEKAPEFDAAVKALCEMVNGIRALSEERE